MRWMSITMSAMDRPKNRCVWMIGVIDTIGICRTARCHLAVLGQQRFVAASAPGRDLVETGLAVALVVQPAIVLGDFNLPGWRVDLERLPLLILVNRVALDLLDVREADIGRDGLDDLLVKALCHSLPWVVMTLWNA
jgi:hypothetical protein